MGIKIANNFLVYLLFYVYVYNLIKSMVLDLENLLVLCICSKNHDIRFNANFSTSINNQTFFFNKCIYRAKNIQQYNFRNVNLIM